MNHEYSSASGAPGIIVLAHDALECGSTQGTSLTKVTSGTVGGDQYEIFDNKTGSYGSRDADLLSACVASGYQSTPSNDFDGPLYLINGNSTNTGVHISSVTGTLATGPTFNPGAITTTTTPTSWSNPPASVAQYNSTVNIDISPTDSSFTSCMTRAGLLWAAQTIANTSSYTQAQWWAIGTGLNTNLNAGQIYIQDTIAPTGLGIVNYDVANPSIVANSNCDSGAGGIPYCDALIGFTAIPTPASGLTSYMSSGYQLEPVNSLDSYCGNVYQVGSLGPYSNCSVSGGPKIPTGFFSSTAVDGYAYPNDTNFFTTQQYGGMQDLSGYSCGAVYDWGVSWAQVPHT